MKPNKRMNRVELEKRLAENGYTENRAVWTLGDSRFVMLTEDGSDDNKAVYGSALAEEAGETMTYVEAASRCVAFEDRPVIVRCIDDPEKFRLGKFDIFGNAVSVSPMTRDHFVDLAPEDENDSDDE